MLRDLGETAVPPLKQMILQYLRMEEKANSLGQKNNMKTVVKITYFQNQQVQTCIRNPEE